MSLDVYLELEDAYLLDLGPKIFIREDGQVQQISYAEWDERYPDQEPVTCAGNAVTQEVYWANITHNLGWMAEEAGIYRCLWRPDENGIERAGQLIQPLSKGLALLESDPERFKAFNPPNGWGDYEGLVEFVRKYLKACEKFPDAKVGVWR